MSVLLALALALPHVTILSTGGTIASQYDEARGGLVPALTGAELVAAVPGLDEVATVSVEQIANIGSPDMTPEIWQKLARRANELLAGDEVAGIVITHGTDTLEETAYFLDLTVTSDKPVIMVGAQRAPSFFDTDGPRNLLNTVRVAVSPEATGKGTFVVMNGQIHTAREVVKTNTIARETFKTLEFGALGVANLGGVKFYRAPLRRQTIAIGIYDDGDGEDDDVRLGRVETVAHYAGADGRLIRALLRDPGGLDGLVIAGTGLGHVSVPMFDAIAEVRERGIPVVISTRVYTGRLMALYAGKGRGVALREIGAVLADNLSPQKARILLMLAMTRTKDPTELQQSSTTSERALGRATLEDQAKCGALYCS